MDSSRGRDVDLDVSLHTTKANTDSRFLEEPLDKLQLHISRDLSLGEMEAEVEGRGGLGLGGSDTRENC
jgi:hypothetical protein